MERNVNAQSPGASGPAGRDVNRPTNQLPPPSIGPLTSAKRSHAASRVGVISPNLTTHVLELGHPIQLDAILVVLAISGRFVMLARHVVLDTCRRMFQRRHGYIEDIAPA